MKQVPFAKIKNHFSDYLHLAEEQEIVIMRQGKPAGVLIGFATEEDWLDYRLEHDERFLARVALARKNLREGQGIRIEELLLGDSPNEKSNEMDNHLP
jgi:prevent-host-death family protein